MSEKRALVTGASGLLGRAVCIAFEDAGWTVMGLSFSRSGKNLVQLNICNRDEVAKVLGEFKPIAIIHCAAQRFPDKVDGDLEGAIKLNVEATKDLAVLSAQAGIIFLYISSDYVFDGTKPPYTENSVPNPLNLYGKTKLQGELVVQEASKDHIILRIPVLYGTVEYLGESAVTVLLDLLFQPLPKSISDYEIRCPSHVRDIASVCLALIERELTKIDGIKGIYQWGGKETLTKFGMVKAISEVFNLPMDHISPDPNPVPGAPRPHNAQLSNTKLEEMGIGLHTPFRLGIELALKPWVDRKRSELL